jgi:hypothetical protein
VLGLLATLVTLTSIVLAVVSLAGAVLRKWPFALRTAKISTALAGGSIAFALVTVLLLIVAPRFAVTIVFRVAPGADPGEKARAMAMAVAEIMNSSVLAVPVLMLAIPIWIIAKKRLGPPAATSSASEDSRAE